MYVCIYIYIHKHTYIYIYIYIYSNNNNDNTTNNNASQPRSKYIITTIVLVDYVLFYYSSIEYVLEVV